MADLIEPIRVVGLTALRKALKEVDASTGPALRKALNKAAQVVVDDAKRRAPVDKGNLRGSIRVSSTQSAARISEGGKNVQYAGFIDFGGSTGRHHRPRIAYSGVIRRPFIKGGRIMYPAYAAKREEVLSIVQAGIVEVVRGSGLDVDGK